VFPKLSPMEKPLKLSVYPGEPLPIKTLTGNETKTQADAHGDYSGIANYRTKTLVIFRQTFGIFRGILKYL
jgi:hypothetical protein